MPIALEILDLRAESPMNLQIEKPPKFIDFLHGMILVEPCHISDRKIHPCRLASFLNPDLDPPIFFTTLIRVIRRHGEIRTKPPDNCGP
jgi:hypothetical protein